MYKFKFNTLQASKKTLIALSAMLIGAWSVPSSAVQINTLFNVSVTLLPAPVTSPPATAPTPPAPIPPGLPISAFCTKDKLPAAHGVVVTLVCATGAVVDIAPGPNARPQIPIHGGAYRYITNVSETGVSTEVANSFLGAGTTTAWRVVRLANRDYLELTLGW